MRRPRVLLLVAAVLAGTAVLMTVLGFVYNLFLLVVAVPFGAAAYFLWYHFTGRLQERMRRQAARDARRRERRATRGRAGARTGSRTNGGGPADLAGPSAAEARRILGVAADADRETVRAAYREKVKEVHPDADGGDEEAFKRVNAAYERLQE